MEREIILEPCEEGGYTATVPGLPGCISEGDTREEALRNIREAIALYVEPVSSENNSDNEKPGEKGKPVGSAGGILRDFNNPGLKVKEKTAWETAVKEKHDYQ